MGKGCSLGSERLKTMRVLVTGGFGFIGARLARHLAAAGYSVRLGSRRYAAQPDWLPQADVVQTCWDDIAALTAACNGMDVIVHAAGMNASDCAADPVNALMFNGVSTARLAQAAKQAGVRRFLYLSTAHVYTSPLAGTLDELTCPRNLHPYASSHLAGETAVLQTAAQGKLEAMVLRLSNAFGSPVMADANCWMLLINDLCRQAVTTGKLSLQSSGNQRRDFISLSTVCTTILALLAQPADALPSVLNIGSGEALKVIEMATLIQQRCQVTLGFTPAIEIGARMEQSLPLHYSSMHAKRLALPATDPVPEIDALLAFCKTHFSTAPK
jgi:UDP-glucose 4-epimerase